MKNRVLLCLSLRVKGQCTKDIHKEIFHVYGEKCFSRKAVHILVENVSLLEKRLKRRCGSGWDNSQKASMLQV
jgi:hypothetical protein